MYLVLQQQGERWRPVHVTEDLDTVRELGEGDFAVYSISDKDPPRLTFNKRLSVTTPKPKVKEIK